MSGEMKQEIISQDGSRPDAHLDDEGKFYLSYESDSVFYETHKAKYCRYLGDGGRFPIYNDSKIFPDDKVFIIDGVQEIGNIADDGFELVMKRRNRIYTVAKWPKFSGYTGYYKAKDGEIYPEHKPCTIL